MQVSVEIINEFKSETDEQLSENVNAALRKLCSIYAEKVYTETVLCRKKDRADV